MIRLQFGSFARPAAPARAVALAAVATALLTLPSALAHAQSPRTTRTNLNSWYQVIGEVELSRRWFIDYDLQLRMSGPADELQQILPRAAVRFQALPNLRLSWGYAFAETFEYGKLPPAFQFPEHRMWEQVQVNGSVGRVSMAHRYRLEQRWLGRVALEDGEEQLQNWVRTNRFRYRVQGTLPLQGATLDDGEFYLMANDEVFLNWGANVQQNVFDQNRLQVMLGRRFTKSLRAEVGYLEQLIAKPNGRQLERNHTLVFAVYPNVSLGR